MHTESYSDNPARPSAARQAAPPAPAAAPAGFSLASAEPGRLHEIQARSPADATSAAASALLLAAAWAPRAPLIWLRSEAAERLGGRVYGPGLADLGVDPARLVLAVLPDDLAILKAGADALASGSAGAVLLELHGPARRLDLTASRRLVLAAAGSGTLAVLLRVSALGQPSAAWRRWSVASLPSRPLAARAPGAPAFAFELTRSRSGPAGAQGALCWRAGSLADQPVPETADDAPRPRTLACPPVPVPVGRPLPRERHASGWQQPGRAA
ncbi:MAG: ImuA family protein [Sandaracinobacteroides sp.]